MKSRGLACVLALFLGGFGIHRFYLDKAGSGILYLLFCWTFIPMIIALIEALNFALMGSETFDKRYNKKAVADKAAGSSDIQKLQLELEIMKLKMQERESGAS